MSSYDDLDIIAADPGFQGRVRYALSIAAMAVYNEAPSTPDHAARLAFAFTVLQSEAYNLQAVALDVLTNATLANEANAKAPPDFNISDGDLQNAVTRLWDVVAGIAPSTLIGPPSALPLDANLLNVRSFGAVGDGVTDDTAAIMAAIAAIVPWAGNHPMTSQIVYLPAGTYLISSTLQRASSMPALILWGDGENRTTIRMKDGAFASGVAGVLTASPNGSPNGGGVFGFLNTLENLTIDVGNNPGAYGLDHMPNNMGIVRHVTVRTDYTAGTGISMLRGGPGPGCLKNVTISGAFGVGIDIAASGTGIWLDSIKIYGTTQFGLRNTMNTVAFNGLSITMAGAGGYAIGNNNPIAAFILPWQAPNEGLIIGVNGSFSGTGLGNISSSASYNFKNVSSTLNGIPASLDGVFHGTTQVPITGSWALSVQDAPSPPPTPVSKWIKAGVNPGFDITGALQAALNTPGASVVYIPTGTYQISGTITVPDTVDIIEGFYSVLNWATTASYLFATNATRTKNLVIRHLTSETYMPGLVNWNSQPGANLILQDTQGFGSLVDTQPNSGSVYGEDNQWTHMNLTNSGQVWMRHLDMEVGSTKINNTGTKLWILGLKTEINSTAVNSAGGANTEVVGGHFYLNEAQPEPLFLTVNSRVATSHNQDTGNTVGAFAATQFDITLNSVHTVIPSTSFPARNPEGSPMVAWYTTDVLPITAPFINLTLPTITGGHVGAGSVLTASVGSWYIPGSLEGSPPVTSFLYQWQRNGTNIAGATSSTYTTVAADLGANLTVQVTAVGSAGNSLPASSGTFNVSATYVGPGDVLTGWMAWYGLRGFSAAYSTGSNFAINVRRDSDNTTKDIRILSNGNLDVAGASAFAAGANLFITKIYDQSGGGFHLSQTTTTLQPKLALGQLGAGALPAVILAGTGLAGAFSTTTTLPIFASLVAQSTSSPGGNDSFITGTSSIGTSNAIGPNSTPLGTWSLYNGHPAPLNFNAAANVLHAVNTSANDTAGTATINMDGTITSGAVGTVAFSGTTGLAIGSYGPFGITSSGLIAEVGFLAGNGNAAALHTNQAAYWGTA